MSLLGTTGTRSTADRVSELMNYIVRPESKLYWESFDGFVSGGCRGWDALFGYGMAARYRDKKHIVVVPSNRSQVVAWWEDFDPGYVDVIEMPENTDYRDRNEKIVSLSSALFYCAEYPEDHVKSKRSGTWMTVRISQAAGITPVGIILNKEQVS